MTKNIDKYLPDFDNVLELIEEIRKLKYQKLLMEIELKNQIARVYTEVTNDPKWFIAGKPPSATYIKSTWEQTGVDNEIIDIRKNLAEVTADLSYSENRLSAYRDMMDIWRTLSANERMTAL